MIINADLFDTGTKGEVRGQFYIQVDVWAWGYDEDYSVYWAECLEGDHEGSYRSAPTIPALFRPMAELYGMEIKSVRIEHDNGKGKTIKL